MRWMLALAAIIALAALPVRAEAPTVLACETLVQLRVLMAAGERPAMEAALSQHPGCRTIPQDRIGAAEHRSMIGGAPFECLAVSGEPACVWVLP